MNYEKMWKEHKQWINNGINYYNSILNNFEDKKSEEYDQVANVLATYEFHLDSLENTEKIEQKKVGEVIK